MGRVLSDCNQPFGQEGVRFLKNIDPNSLSALALLQLFAAARELPPGRRAEIRRAIVNAASREAPPGLPV
jgi:hypothetical protein